MSRSTTSSLALAAAAFLLYASRLEHTPIYLYNAEILFGLQAHSIATTAHDLSGRLLPLYFQMRPIGDNVWFHPVIVYITAAFLTILPFGEWAVRLPSAVIGATNVLLMYHLAKRIFQREREALLAAALLTLTPAHFIHSRIAMDYLYPVPFVLAWMLALTIFLEQKRLSALFAATSMLGIGVYSYIASVVMMPVYLLFTMAALWRAGHASRRTLLVTLAGFAWPLVALPLWLWSHPVVVTETVGRYHLGPTVRAASGASVRSMLALLEDLTHRRLPWSSVTGRVSLFWYFFDPAYLFVTGGYANVLNSTRHTGVFALPLIVLVPAGLLHLLRGQRSVVENLVLAGFFSAPLAACLAVPEPYAIDRELALLPFGVLLAVFGLLRLRQSGREFWRGLAAITVALVPVHFAFFYYDYFTDYRRHSAIWFELNHRGAMEELVARDAHDHPPAIYLPVDKDPYMEANWWFTLTKLGRLELRDRTVLYSASSLPTSTIPERSLVLLRRGTPEGEALARSGQLRIVSTVPELADPPEFLISQR